MSAQYTIRWISNAEHKRQKEAKRKERNRRKALEKTKPAESWLKKPILYIDSKKYAIDQRISPVVWSAAVAAGGVAGLDFVVDKILSISEKTAAVGSTGGKIALTGLTALAVYELGYGILKGTEKSRIPLVKKIKFPGLWRATYEKNKELYTLDKEHEISRLRKSASYAKNLALAGLFGAMIMTGAAKNTIDNLRFNFSELFYVDKGTVELSPNQAKTIDTILQKQESQSTFNLGSATDSQIKQSIIEAELYRMTDTQWERKECWEIKKKIKKYEDIIKREASENNLNPSLVEGLIFVESKGNPKAKSPMNAKGLMQLMPETAKAYGVTNPYDPEQNIIGGTQCLKDNLDRCKGNIPLALTLYNCDSKAVDWAIKKSGSDDPFVFAQWLQKEAREYAIKVTAATIYMVNGEVYNEASANNPEDKTNNIGNEFTYLRKNPKGQHIFSYKVQEGDTSTSIARQFNKADNQNGDCYKEVIFKVGVVNSKGYFVGNAIKPGQEVYIRADKR